MVDYFDLLDLPRQADLDEEIIQQRYHAQIAKYHPDKANDEIERAEYSRRSTDLNQAWSTLRNPVLRVRHLLELIAPDLERDSGLSEELMSLFGETGQAIQEADAYLTEKKKAASALAKALLAEREVEVQEKLQEVLGKVTATQGQLDLQVSEPEAVRALHTQLSFLDKWQRQLNERLLLLLLDE